MLVNDTLKAFSFQILTGPIYSIFPDWIPWSSLCKGVFPFLFWSSPSGFHSAAPSTFLSGNKGKWRQRHHKQQVLAGSSCQWNDSFGLLRHRLGRLLTISFHVDFCVVFSVTWVLILSIFFCLKWKYSRTSLWLSQHVHLKFFVNRLQCRCRWMHHGEPWLWRECRLHQHCWRT